MNSWMRVIVAIAICYVTAVAIIALRSVLGG